MAARLADALPHITIADTMADPHEVPIAHRCIGVVASLLKRISKQVLFYCYDRLSARYLMELLPTVAGEPDQPAEVSV